MAVVDRVKRLGSATVRLGGLLLAGLALSAATPPERWLHVGGSAAFEEYLDSESVQRNGDKVTLWTRRDYASGQATAWHEIEFDCSARTETILAWVRDDGGTVSHNVVRPHRASSPIPPGSIEERTFNIACR